MNPIKQLPKQDEKNVFYCFTTCLHTLLHTMVGHYIVPLFSLFPASLSLMCARHERLGRKCWTPSNLHIGTHSPRYGTILLTICGTKRSQNFLLFLNGLIHRPKNNSYKELTFKSSKLAYSITYSCCGGCVSVCWQVLLEHSYNSKVQASKMRFGPSKVTKNTSAQGDLSTGTGQQKSHQNSNQGKGVAFEKSRSLGFR